MRPIEWPAIWKERGQLRVWNDPVTAPEARWPSANEKCAEDHGRATGALPSYRKMLWLAPIRQMDLAGPAAGPSPSECGCTKEWDEMQYESQENTPIHLTTHLIRGTLTKTLKSTCASRKQKS